MFIFAGIDSIGFDPQRFAMDYHVIGFRECASEVARYMISVEGMDIQDPMRLRLMSHLQCFVAQRELSVKTSGATNSNWQNSYQSNYSAQSYQNYPTAPTTPNQQHQNSFNSSYMTSPTSSYLSTTNNSSLLSSTATSQSPEYSSGYGASNASSANTSATPTTQSNISSTTSSSVVATATAAIPNEQLDSHPVYTDLSNTNDRLLNLGGSYLNYGNQLYGTNNNNGYNNNANNSKPYRPWHPEMSAY